MNNQQTLSLPVNRIPPGRLGLWILIAGEFMIFGGAVACYVLYRLRHPEWAEQAELTSLFLGSLNTVILLLSSYTIVRAHQAALSRNIQKTTMWMSATIVGALLFLVNKIIEYTSKVSQGITFSPDWQGTGENSSSLFWSFYYFMTGLHAAHVLVGIIVMFIIIMQIKKGANLHRVELVGMYWHFVDLIWLLLFPLFYIAR